MDNHVTHIDQLAKYFNSETNCYDLPGGISLHGNMDFGTASLSFPDCEDEPKYCPTCHEPTKVTLCANNTDEYFCPIGHMSKMDKMGEWE